MSPVGPVWAFPGIHQDVAIHNPQQWEYPCHRRVSRAERTTARIPLHPMQKKKQPSILLRKNLKKRNKRKIHPKIQLFRKKPNPSLSGKVPLVSKVQEVGGFTGCSPLGIPAFYPDLCWESRKCSQVSHSYCLGGSEAVEGAEAEQEEHPWSDSPGSPKLCKACEGALRAGGLLKSWESPGGMWGSHSGLAECWSGERPLSERKEGV